MQLPLSAAESMPKPARLVGIDLLRGLVMVLMTLDHTRDFFSAAHFDPLDLERTTPALFLTRWITHFCAPVFIFFAGAAACLAGTRQSSQFALARFLVGRGVLIGFLGITLESVIWTPRPDFSVITGSVLWAIACSMLFLALLLPLRSNAITAIGVAMILGHNAFDAVRAEDLPCCTALWSVLHSGEPVRLRAQLVFEPYYPLLPWLGVMAAGYGCGRILLLEPTLRKAWLMRLGGSMLLLFLLLRWSNFYGDPNPWAVQRNLWLTALDFVKCRKYPPSLLYLLMTLGPALVLLAQLERAPRWLHPLLLPFGRVPLFYYLLHLPVIVALAVAVEGMRTGTYPNVLDSPFSASAYGYGLPVVYLLCGCVLLLLYPLCVWFTAFKERHPDRQWLRYL